MRINKNIIVSFFVAFSFLSWSQNQNGFKTCAPKVVREFTILTIDGKQREMKENMHIKQFNMNGKVISDQLIYMMSFDKQNSQKVYTYNKKGNLVLEEQKVHSNKDNKYVDFLRIYYKYDRKGNCVKRTTLSFQNDHWVQEGKYSVPDFKKKFKYNKQDIVISEQTKKYDTLLKIWKKETKVITSFKNELPITQFTYKYDFLTKTWINTSQIDSIQVDSKFVFQGTKSIDFTEKSEHLKQFHFKIVNGQDTRYRFEKNDSLNITYIDTLTSDSKWGNKSKKTVIIDSLGSEKEIISYTNSTSGYVIQEDLVFQHSYDKNKNVVVTYLGKKKGTQIIFTKKVEYDDFVIFEKQVK